MILGRNIIDVVFVLFWLFGFCFCCFVFVVWFLFLFLFVWLLIVFDTIAKTNNKITNCQVVSERGNLTEQEIKD